MIDYEKLKIFYGLLVESVFDSRHVAGESNPIWVLEKIEQKSRAVAMRSLRMGVSDAMAMLRDERPETVADLSTRLLIAGAPSIALVRAYLSKRCSAILKHGAIETDDQFYFVREMVGEPNLMKTDRDRLIEMLSVYEATLRDGLPPSTT